MRHVESATYPVTLADGDQANGIANIVGTLLGQNFESFPSRIHYAQRMPRPVTIVSTDTDSACTIVFNRGGATVYNDVVGRPSVTVIATVEQILDVSQLPMKAGGLVPVGFFTERGLTVLRSILTRKMVVKGLLAHTITALRTIALVSVIES
jgi:hypothetical protein